ncbi:NAD-dependent epimerase/dehydratase family protein [Kineococcus sp. SYSU DK005]|uniref:NAD-dependent epimerase/dehydratase family protein n=1 Tax=Kineococcus sp. SYSU DK005 TaxID=3383126 RepID=UPI003D7D4D16
MRVVVIGATGHVGTHLVPRLVRAGHDVVAVSRGTREPYHPHPAWERVERVRADRDAEDAAGTFGERVAALRPDAVVDLVCFTPASAAQLVEALRGRCGHLLHAGTIWVHGPAAASPLTEDDPREPFGEYGTRKAQVERLLLAETRAGGLACTVLHPGHISGAGWPVITPLGNLDPDVWHRLATGAELAVPGLGLETLHHVHADDVAQAFELALHRRSAAAGESFHVVSDRAVTVRGFAAAAAAWFGRGARLRHVGWEEFRELAGEHADASWEHLARSHSASTAKARALLGYAPRFTSVAAAADSVRWAAAHGALDLAGRDVPLV